MRDNPAKRRSGNAAAPRSPTGWAPNKRDTSALFLWERTYARQADGARPSGAAVAHWVRSYTRRERRRALRHRCLSVGAHPARDNPAKPQRRSSAVAHRVGSYNKHGASTLFCGSAPGARQADGARPSGAASRTGCAPTQEEKKASAPSPPPCRSAPSARQPCEAATPQLRGRPQGGLLQQARRLHPFCGSAPCARQAGGARPLGTAVAHWVRSYTRRKGRRVTPAVRSRWSCRHPWVSPRR